jgi:hypothetical protein
LGILISKQVDRKETFTGERGIWLKREEKTQVNRSQPATRATVQGWLVRTKGLSEIRTPKWGFQV